jgi:hypothetical protein
MNKMTVGQTNHAVDRVREIARTLKMVFVSKLPDYPERPVDYIPKTMSNRDLFNGLVKKTIKLRKKPLTSQPANRGPNTQITTYFEFPSDPKQTAYEKEVKKYEKAKSKIRESNREKEHANSLRVEQEQKKIIDQIILGDNVAALKAIEAFAKF